MYTQPDPSWDTLQSQLRQNNLAIHQSMVPRSESLNPVRYYYYTPYFFQLYRPEDEWPSQMVQMSS